MKTKKILYNIISELLFQGIALICGLIVPQMILEAYGSAYNGIIQTIIQLVEYIYFLTLGIDGPTRVAIYGALAAKDNGKLNAVLRANEIYMRKVGAALVGYMLFLAVVYPWMVRADFAWWDVASLILIIGIGELMQYLFGNSSQVLLTADQRHYIWTILMIISKVASTVSAAVLIKRGSSIHVVRLAMMVCFAVVPVLTDVITKPMYHITSKVNPDFSAIRQRGDAAAHSLADIIDTYAPTFLLILLTNPIAVSIYSIYNLIFQNIQRIQTAFTSNLEGAFGEFWVKGEKDKFSEKFCTLEYLMMAFLLLFYTTAATLILPFMRIYMAEITDANYILPVFASLFVCATATDSLRVPYVVAIQAAGKYRETKKMVTIEAVINVAVSLIGVLAWGLNGILLGPVSANLFHVIGYARFCYKEMLTISVRKFVIKMVWLLANSAMIIGMQLFVTNHVLTIEGWMQWVIAGFACVCIAGVILLVSSILFYRTEILNVFHLVKTMLRRTERE